jgi:hypothetical protein
MDLPLPTFSFAIPSIHDGKQLECRIYLPPAFQNIESATAWANRGAIVAHPYAPLGGCYDDPVVSFIGSELLHSDCIVGTFNFRYYYLLLALDHEPKQLIHSIAEPGTLKDEQAGLPNPS